MPITTVSIPTERRRQLDQISEVFGTTTTTETIGEMIRVLARLGVASTTIDGIELNRCSDGIAVIVDGGDPVPLTWADAARFAERLRHYIESGDRLPVEVNIDGDWSISRKGNGINLQFPIGAKWKTISRDLARDLVELVERAIKSAA